MMLPSNSARRRSVLAGAALIVLLGAAACGGDDSTTGSDETATTAPIEAPLPTDPNAGGSAAGACLAGATDCADNPGVDNGVPEQPDGTVSIADALATSIDGSFVIKGFFHSDGTATQLCSALAESFPPQCSEGIAFDNRGGVDLGALEEEGDVQWSAQPVEVIGQVVDGVFVAG